jgi:hypothetical protein
MSVPFVGTNFARVDASIRSWIQSLLTSTIIVYEAYTTTVRPTGPHVTCQMREVKQIGYDYVPPPGIQVGSVTSNLGVYELTYSLVSYSSSAATNLQILQAIRQGLQDDSYSTLYTTAGVGFMRLQGGCIDVSMLQASSDPYMTRVHQMDVVFSAVNIYADDIGEIDTVNASGAIYQPDGTELFNKSFEIPPQEGT